VSSWYFWNSTRVMMKWSVHLDIVELD